MMLAADCATVPYAEALAWQRQLVAARHADELDDVVLTLEHEPVYTTGRHADPAHVLGTSDIPVVRTDRGGDVTYHGPGQLVVYPIIALREARAVRRYVQALEDACTAAAADFGVTAQPARAQAGRRRGPRTGVWVGGDKLAAIGIRVDRGVTSHGLAFNVHPDLDAFAGIVPCGLHDAGVCSLASLGVPVGLPQVRARLVARLAESLERPVRWVRAAELGLPVAV